MTLVKTFEELEYEHYLHSHRDTIEKAERVFILASVLGVILAISYFVSIPLFGVESLIPFYIGMSYWINTAVWVGALIVASPLPSDPWI